MANGTVQTGLIERVKINNDTEQRIASTAYGVCSTTASTAAKTVQIDGFELVTGVTIHVKFTHDNTATDPPTLNVNGTGAINMVQYHNVAIGITSETSGWEAGAVLSLTYDGTYWVRDQGYNTNTTYSVVSTNAAGLVPQANAVNTQSQTTKFLREDGTWAEPSYTVNVDVAVTQTGVTTNKDYPILLKNTDDISDETAGVKYGKATNKLVTINPSTGIISAIGFDGSGASLTSLNASNLSSGTVNLSRLPSIPNSQLTYSSITIANNEFSLGDSMSKADFLTLLGLSSTLHFIGVATHNQLSDGSTVDPFNSSSTYHGADGDIVIDSNNLREYIWSNGEWLLLGLTLSAAYDSNSITATSNDTPTWVSRITQTTDGLISVEKETLGVIEVSHGGTGVNSFTANQVILSGSTSTSDLVSRAYSDNTSATALTSSSTNFATERSIYYALPTINNVHNYDSSTTLFAPISQGTTNQILVANSSTHTPEWTAAALLESNTSTTANQAAYTYLTLGNSGNIATTTSHSEGKIYLYSASTHAHIIQGQSTTNNYIHILPNAEGVLVQIPSAAAVGGSTQPVYVASDGTITAITYTPNRLYYSASASSFAATGHYATSTSIGVNITSWPENNTDTLYVNGTTTLNGNTIIAATTDVDTSNSLYGALKILGGAYITKKLRVVDDVIFNDTLSVANTTTLSNNVGIGAGPDDSASDNHILLVKGSTILKGANNSVAHLDISTTNSTDSLLFIPETTATGIIGTDLKQWNSASFSNSLTIGQSTQGIFINHTGKIDIINDTSYIKFYTIDDSNGSIGTIEIKTAIPTITLTTTSTLSGSTTLEDAWVIHNTSGNLTITNDSNTLIYANDYGVQITDRLYINEDVDNTSTLDFYVDGTSQLNDNVGIGIIPDASNLTDMHILSVNGSILISNSDAPTAHLDVDIDSNSVSYLMFYPDVVSGGNAGYIGLDSARWKYGYFSHILEVGTMVSNTLVGIQLDGSGTTTIVNGNSSITLDTTPASLVSQSVITLVSSNGELELYTGNTNDSMITMTGASPSITLNALSATALDWIIINDIGTFSINNQNLNLVSLDGNTRGFELTSRLYINNTIPNTQDYILYIGEGDTCFDGNAIPTLNNGVANKTLGDSSARWAALYVGTADTYGDTALPIYWNDGVPTYTNGVLQKKSFTFANNTTSVVLEDAAYNQLYGIETYVIQIVVTSGEEYLNDIIDWTSRQKANSTTVGEIVLSCGVATTGVVSGYILTARGASIDPVVAS